MRIVITGGAGFLGQHLTRYLIEEANLPNLEEITLVDIVPAPVPVQDQRIKVITANLSESNQLSQIITPKTTVVFHLAAIVSGQAEAEFELGMQINFDLTRHLLEHIRHTNSNIRLIFASSLAVFGGQLPDIIEDTVALSPQSSYGTQKAMAELLIHDYSRKGYLDGVVLRLPTISIRPGKPNQAASSFASGIIREPLQGLPAICPVDPELALWISSPRCVIQNLVHAIHLPASNKTRRSINLPGMTITVKDMLADLRSVAGEQVYQLVSYQFDERINQIVGSWPSRFNIQTALQLGFTEDQSFQNNIKSFIHTLKGE